MRFPAAAGQEPRHRVVHVGGGDHPLRREAQRTGDQPGRDIAEVAAGHAEDEAPDIRGSRSRLEVVADLRQQARDVDRIGGVQTQLPDEVLVQEGLLDHGLAGIEITFNGKRSDISTQCAKELLLQRGHSTPRIEHHDIDPGLTKKCLGHGCTCVT